MNSHVMRVAVADDEIACPVVMPVAVHVVNDGVFR
jgi:hypothetical protein